LLYFVQPYRDKKFVGVFVRFRAPYYEKCHGGKTVDRNAHRDAHHRSDARDLWSKQKRETFVADNKPAGANDYTVFFSHS
jgi:hypothetical protein